MVNNHMRLKFVTIGENLKWPRGRLSLARKKNTKGIYDSRFSSSKNNSANHDPLDFQLQHYWKVEICQKLKRN